MRSRTTWFVMVLLAVLAAEMGIERYSGSWPLHEAIRDLKNNLTKINGIVKFADKGKAVKKGVSEVFTDAKFVGEAFSIWAHYQLYKGLRYIEEELKKTGSFIGSDPIIKTTQRINTAAAADASEKGGEAVKAAAAASEKVRDGVQGHH